MGEVLRRRQKNRFHTRAVLDGVRVGTLLANLTLDIDSVSIDLWLVRFRATVSDGHLRGKNR